MSKFTQKEIRDKAIDWVGNMAAFANETYYEELDHNFEGTVGEGKDRLLEIEALSYIEKLLEENNE